MRLQELVEADVKLSDNSQKAREWINRVYELYPQQWQNNHVMPLGDEQFAMFELTPSFSKRGAVEVKWFQAYPLRQGIGSQAMKQLQSLAREDGIALTLFPWDKGQVSQSKLTKFYRAQGFKPTIKGAKNMAWTPESILDEAFDQPYPMTWEKSEADDSMDALARLPDGSNLSIMFNIEYDEEGEEVIQVEFHRNNSQEVTGDGDAQRVFATVLAAIQQYIKTHKPKRLTFSASKEVEPDQNSESRAKLYDRLVMRYARTWGYRPLRADTGTIVRYELSRLKQGVAEGKEQFNYELAQKGFHFEQEINGVTYRVSNKKGGSDNINIEALDDKGQSIGFARFWMHQYKDGLESLSTQVRDDWQGKGIAANMYAVMRMLGVNIHPASTQSDDGKKMWDKWNKQGDAQHIKSMNAKMTEQGVADDAQLPGDFKLMGQNLFLKNLARNLKQRYPDATVKLLNDRVTAYHNEGDDERLTVMGTEVMDSGYIGVGLDDAFTESFQGVLVPTIKQTTEQLLAANPGTRPALFLSTDNWNPDAWTHIATKLGYRLVADDESLDEQGVTEGQLNELGNSPSEYKPNRKRKRSLFHATVDNNWVDVFFDRSEFNDTLHITFTVNGDYDAPSQPTSASKSTVKILSTVLNIIKKQLPEYIAKARPPAISFTAKGDSRASLYRKYFVPVIQDILGAKWAHEEYPSMGMIVFHWRPIRKTMGEELNEISDDLLQRYLGRADTHISRRLDRMSQARERLNKGYEIYDANKPTRIIHRFEANTPAQAKEYYYKFIDDYDPGDHDFEFSLRRSTGIPESITEDQDYMAGHCHVMAIALKMLHPTWQIRAHVGWEDDEAEDDEYRVDHVYIVAPDGSAYDCRGRFNSEEALVGEDVTGGFETQYADFDLADIQQLVQRGELKRFTREDINKAVAFAKRIQQ